MINHYKSPLLVPISVGSLKLKNRLVVLPMACAHGDGSEMMRSQMPEQSIAYYERKARGGFALIIREGDSPYFTEEDLPGHKELCDRVHAAGAKILGQCGYVGRQVGNPCYAPSPVPCMTNDVIPQELTVEEIKGLEDQMAEKAFFCMRAGYDGVEFQGGHGYLIAEFMSTYANKRNDEYGGTVENRMRFPLEIVRKVRERCGYDYTISFRISADEFLPGGRTIEDSKVMAVMLEKAGVDMINVSAASYGSEEHYISPMEFPTACLADLAKEIKSVVNVPVLATNRVRDPKVAENLIINGKCDLVGMGRASLADPELPNKFFSDRYNEIRPCIGCNQGCLDNLHHLRPVTCLVNPEIGNEYKKELKTAETAKKVTVVGGGPAGVEAAITAARAGHQVTLYDKNHYIGGNFYLAAIPPTKGPIAEFLAWARGELDRLNVNVKLNTTYSVDTYNEEQSDAVILATGSNPLVPPIKGINLENVVTAEDILLGKVQAGRKVVVCGGGLVGAETATHLAMNKRYDLNDRKVSVVEMRPIIAPDEEFTRRIGLMSLIDDLKIDCHVNAKVSEIQADSVVVEMDGELQKIPCDTVVLAFGYRPENKLYEQLKNKDNVQCIGDASRVGNALKATREGFLAGCNL